MLVGDLLVYKSASKKALAILLKIKKYNIHYFQADVFQLKSDWESKEGARRRCYWDGYTSFLTVIKKQP